MEEKIKNCYCCGKEFLYKNNKNIYCSINCKAKHSRNNKGILIKKICKNCKKEFDTVSNLKIFCSNVCRKKYFVKNPIKHKYKFVCNYCGKNFEKILSNKPKENRKHYCSLKCMGYDRNKIGIETEYNCKECNKRFKQINKRHYFCSKECKKIYGNKHAPMKKVYCSNCNKKIERIRSLRRKNFFCCRKCESNFREKEANDIRICKYCQKEFVCKKHDKLIFCSKTCQICGMNKSPTKPHRKVIKFIKKLGLSFEIEKSIKRYSIDVYLLKYNIGLEIMGEYWHCDNRFYNIPKSEAQKDGIRKDKKKNKYFKHNNIQILYLWEFDINKNFDVCKKLIIEFIKNYGVLDNYHSMNYFIKNKELFLNKEILIPYFEK